jgi:hypothetical protein
MSRAATRNLMLAVALIAVVAAVLIIALSGGGSKKKAAAAGSGAGSQSAAQAASSYLGIGLGTVRRRLQNGETLQEIANSTPGHSAQALERAIVAEHTAELRKEGATSAEAAAAARKLRARLRAQLRRKRRSGALVRSASRYLGIDEAALREQLRSGKTLTEIAADHGHSREQLIEGVIQSRVLELQNLRKRGQISLAEEKRAISLLRAKVARVVESKNL